MLDDPDVGLPIVDAVATTRKALALQVGIDAPEKTTPTRAATIARQRPDLRILMVHMGVVGHADLTRAAIEVMRDHPNVTAAGSADRDIPILRAVKELGPERVCFGSDTPFHQMHVDVAKYRALLGGEIPSEDEAKAMGENILRVLGADQSSSAAV